MIGSSPISKFEDRIVITAPKSVQEFRKVCIFLDCVMIPFSFLLYLTKEYNPRVIIIILFLWSLVLIINIIIFGFKTNYVFNKRSRNVYKEGNSLFIPFQKLICSFDDISDMGVKSYRQKIRKKYGGESIHYSYFLVFATKQNPSAFIDLASTEGINHCLSFEEINKIGELLSKTVNCRFIKGEPTLSIKASQSGTSVEYSMGESIKSLLDYV